MMLFPDRGNFPDCRHGSIKSGVSGTDPIFPVKNNQEIINGMSSLDLLRLRSNGYRFNGVSSQ